MYSPLVFQAALCKLIKLPEICNVFMTFRNDSSVFPFFLNTAWTLPIFRYYQRLSSPLQQTQQNLRKKKYQMY